MIAAALWNEIEGTAIPAAEPFGFKLVGLFPVSRVMVGSMKVEKHASSLIEMVPVPFKGLQCAGRDRREKGVVPADLLNETAGVTVIVARLEPFPDFRVDLQGMGNKGNVDRYRDSRSDHIHELDRRCVPPSVPSRS